MGILLLWYFLQRIKSWPNCGNKFIFGLKVVTKTKECFIILDSGYLNCSVGILTALSFFILKLLLFRTSFTVSRIKGLWNLEGANSGYLSMQYSTGLRLKQFGIFVNKFVTSNETILVCLLNFRLHFFKNQSFLWSYPALTCLKSAIETPEQCVKSV